MKMLKRPFLNYSQLTFQQYLKYSKRVGNGTESPKQSLKTGGQNCYNNERHESKGYNSVIFLPLQISSMIGIDHIPKGLDVK